MNIFIYLTEKNKEVLEVFFLIIKKKNFMDDFKFVRDVGVTFQYIFNNIISKKIKKVDPQR